MIMMLGIAITFISGYKIYKLNKGKIKYSKKSLKTMLYVLLVLGALVTVIGIASAN